MKRISRTLALVIALCMILSLSVFAADVTWQDYQNYLVAAAGGNAPDLAEFQAQVAAIGSWAEMPLDQSPWDQLFTTLGISTWDQFVAAGGVGAQSSQTGSMGGASSGSSSGETAAAAAPASAGPAASASGEAVSANAPATAQTKDVSSMLPSSYEYLTNYSNRKTPGKIYVEYDQTASGEINLNETVTGEGFTAVYAHGANADVTVGGTLVLADSSDGQNTSDFSGQGSATVAYDGAKLDLKDLTYYSEGFERGVTVVSQNAEVTIEDSDITVMGNDPLTNAWEGYHSSADQNYMISPPWCLGITGGARILNMIGATPKLTIKDSVLTGGRTWGLLSTDSGSNMTINVVDSDLISLPESQGGSDSGWRIFGYDENAYGSAYGSYYIGNPTQYYYGANFKGVTYAAIITGAEKGVYASSNGVINLVDASGAPMGTVTGKGRPTVIDGVFGFMQHNSINDGIYVIDGTIVNAADAIVIHKAAKGNWVFDNAVLNSGTGVLFQMIDNDDDSRIGGNPMDVSTGFSETYSDSKIASSGIGFPGINYAVTTSTGGYDVTVSYDNGAYNGNIYNGTGYYGKAGDNLTINLGSNAVLNGDIALTSTIKAVPYSDAALKGIAYYGSDINCALLDANGNITYNTAQAAYIQITDYTINEYFLQGHVQNKVHFNGVSTLSVNLESGAVWNVASESLLTSLNIAPGAVVRGTLIQNADGSITLIPGTSAIPAGSYGGTVAVYGGANVAGGGVTADGVLDVGAAMASSEAAAAPAASSEPAAAAPAASSEPAAAAPAASSEPAAAAPAASSEPAAAAPAAAGGDVSEAAYKAYLKAWLAANPAVQEHIDEFYANIDAGAYYDYPMDMCFTDQWFGFAAMTYAEFQAAGGVYVIPAFDPNLAPD